MRDERFTRGGQRSSRIPLHGAWHWMQMGDVQSPIPPPPQCRGNREGSRHLCREPTARREPTASA